ncbi:MAG: serine/threonine protein phosphatase PrpC/predicted Ser/Thr protein kinase [bacterium]|jgi:serine/threonine protein phosphatase PrpC/predicted Ser/Thr protein kinase
MNLFSHQVTHQIGQYSTKGRKKSNQDCVSYLIPEEEQTSFLKGTVGVISDGISTSNISQEASQICVEQLIQKYFSTALTIPVALSVQQVIQQLNSNFYQRNMDQPEYNMYSATLSVIVVKSNYAHIFHVGDSRIYLLRNGILTQVTQDHCQKRGNDTFLERAIGLEAHVIIDYQKIEVTSGDIFFLATDGVYEFISQKELITNLSSRNNLNQVAEEITQIAFQTESKDNLSCQILKVGNTPIIRQPEIYEEIKQRPFLPNLEVGNQIEHFKVLEEVELTKRSSVYLVLDTKSDEKFILKSPSIHFQDEPALLEKFFLEEWVLSQIQSPNILHKSFSSTKFCYFTTEYIQGKSLKQWSKENPLPTFEKVLPIIEQIFTALSCLHQLSVFHQDIKPDNILIDDQGIVTIIDFGSAEIQGVSEITHTFKCEEALNTKSFAVPEKPETHLEFISSDLYSVGILVYNMLTGRFPYEDFGAIIKHPVYISILNTNPKAPEWIDWAVYKAIHPDPKERYDSSQPFLSDLQKVNKKIKRTFPFQKKKKFEYSWFTGGMALVILMMLLYLFPFIFIP